MIFMFALTRNGTVFSLQHNMNLLIRLLHNYARKKYMTVVELDYYVLLTEIIG